MQREHSYSTKNIWWLRFLMLGLICVTWYAVTAMHHSENLYSEVENATAAEPVVIATRNLEGQAVKIPSYDLFKPGGLWALVSKKHPLKSEAGYQLIDIPVAHGDTSQPMKIAVDISNELQQLVNAAEADGEPLMVSSAYRSLAEQRKVYDEFVAKNGETLAKQYVSPVGASEHHTGLAIDLSSVSDECADDSNSCSLSQSGAAWLAQNASKYGFIQRYPAGDQDITGVAYEPWHFRFVGKPLAKILAEADLTYDEAVAELAPGYAH